MLYKWEGKWLCPQISSFLRYFLGQIWFRGVEALHFDFMLRWHCSINIYFSAWGDESVGIIMYPDAKMGFFRFWIVFGLLTSCGDNVAQS